MLTSSTQVHLVSEHVWCEDYLVRSLYLKNSQTGETRTVTQFHFLSWPDGNIPTSTKAILEFRRSVGSLEYCGVLSPVKMLLLMSYNLFYPQMFHFSKNRKLSKLKSV